MDKIHSTHPLGGWDTPSIFQNVVLTLHLSHVYESISVLLTFTVTFSFLLLLHTGWHFWENGHTLVDAIIRNSRRCQSLTAAWVFLIKCSFLCHCIQCGCCCGMHVMHVAFSQLNSRHVSLSCVGKGFSLKTKIIRLKCLHPPPPPSDFLHRHQ